FGPNIRGTIKDQMCLPSWATHKAQSDNHHISDLKRIIQICKLNLETSVSSNSILRLTIKTLTEVLFLFNAFADIFSLSTH
ncbi:hypothetical protein BgiMline_032216, partial [Biomphalaria glabrata]